MNIIRRNAELLLSHNECHEEQLLHYEILRTGDKGKFGELQNFFNMSHLDPLY